MLKIYTYQGCSTCRAAVKWLKAHAIVYAEHPIRETPPTVTELRAMLTARGGNLRALFNSSGQDYRSMGMKEKLPGMSEQEALEALSKNGNLVKRPFALDESKALYLLAFKQLEWEGALA